MHSEAKSAQHNVGLNTMQGKINHMVDFTAQQLKIRSEKTVGLSFWAEMVQLVNENCTRYCAYCKALDSIQSMCIYEVILMYLSVSMNNFDYCTGYILQHC